MKNIREIQEEIIEEFEMFDDWMQKYEYLIDLGKEMPNINSKFKIDDNLIKGCQSRVWLNSELNFIDKIGLKEQLSATRANGLLSMIKQMKIYALALKS